MKLNDGSTEGAKKGWETRRHGKVTEYTPEQENAIKAETTAIREFIVASKIYKKAMREIPVSGEQVSAYGKRQSDARIAFKAAVDRMDTATNQVMLLGLKREKGRWVKDVPEAPKKVPINDATAWAHVTVNGRTVQSLLDEKRSIAVKEKLSKDELDRLQSLNNELDKVDFMGSVKYHPTTKIKASPDMDYDTELLKSTVEDLRSGKVTRERLQQTVGKIDDEIAALKTHDGKDGISYSEEFKGFRAAELQTAKDRINRALNETKSTEDEEDATTRDLSKGGFADTSIASNVEMINNAGIETEASCSAMLADHHGEEQGGPYLSVTLPETVVRHGFGFDYSEIDPKEVKNESYITALEAAGRKAGWEPKRSKYMMMIPVVSYYLPKTATLAQDAAALKEPDVIDAEQQLDTIMADPNHSVDTFLAALDRRNEIRDAAYEKHGGIVKRSDADLKVAWDKLTKELVKVSPKLKKIASSVK